MINLPAITGKVGFKIIRIRGGHHFLRHNDGRCTVIPIYGKETISKGLLVKILRDCEIDRTKLKNKYNS